MKILTYLAVIVVLLSACVQGNNSDVEDPREHAEKFFEFYKNQSPDVALDYIYSDELIEKGEELKQNIENMKSQLNDLENYLGAYQSYDYVNTEKKGETIIASSYLANYEQQPLLFIFIFYKPGDKWQLLHFNYNDGIDRKMIQKLQEG